MTDEEFAALEADVAERNDKLADLRGQKETAGEVFDALKAEIRTLQKETDPLETKLREETSRRRGGPAAATIGLGG